jgi:deoxyribodipyrimidine photo-lyase
MIEAKRTDERPPALLWLRDDLRVDDHPALAAAAADGPVAALYILDDSGKSGRPLGGAARWWLHHSLTALAARLSEIGVPLVFRRGSPDVIVPQVTAEIGAASVHWTRRYYGWSKPLDASIKQSLTASGVKVESHKGSVLTEPWEIKTGYGGAFKVFTPFKRAAISACDMWASFAAPLPAITGISGHKLASEALADWHLQPTKPNWSVGLAEMWTPGEVGAAAKLDAFLTGGIAGYKENRNVPSVVGTSRLSPHLRHGEISIRRVWNAVRAKIISAPELKSDGETYLSELIWREFSTQLVYHFEDFPDQSWKPPFRSFPWIYDAAALKAWQRGQTGYPIVDAGMRELYTTGWMHNRVRMIVGSFLVKHLLQDWRLGEAWFWDTLVDSDIANNAAGWQWVAGSGADASPFFRIFNPMTQGETFDPKGQYVRHWVPEIARLPDSLIHRPFDAAPPILASLGITLGQTYPRPIIDHAKARARALEALASIKGMSAGESV